MDVVFDTISVMPSRHTDHGIVNVYAQRVFRTASPEPHNDTPARINEERHHQADLHLVKRNLRIATFYSGRAPLNRPSRLPDPQEKAGRSRQPWLPRLPGDMQHHDGGDGASRKAATGAATVAQAAASLAPPCCMATPDRRRARSGLAPRHATTTRRHYHPTTA
jgi:hypothetical protein